ncbi:MAG: peptidylprolyl isomerase [Candidatus Aenigmarchaeota archaeon]|nr:peptidylprolyl isomerase [Candidatus Aenigmarchaeota archaeon]
MKKGDFVYISYIGRLESGEIFDLTDEETAKKEKILNTNMKYSPVPVIVGEKFIIPGIDEALLEMKIGDEKELTIEPEKGFGKRDSKLLKVFPKSMFKNDVKAGMVVDMGGMPGRIQSVEAGRVRVDFNNPMAGKVLRYKIKVEKKVEKDDEKVKAFFEYFSIKPEISVKENELEIISAIPQQLRKRASEIIFKYTKIEKIKFIEVCEKGEKAKDI